MWLILLVNIGLTFVAVWVHYACLGLMADRLVNLTRHRRRHLLLAVFGVLAAHVIEIWVYAITFYVLIKLGESGTLLGTTDNTLLECFYFSISSYTSLGMGDIHPTGSLRFVTGFEALTGLVLITWTASFLFIEMEKVWSRHKR